MYSLHDSELRKVFTVTMQNNYCQAEDGGSHGIGIARAVHKYICTALGIAIAIGIAIGDRLSRQFDLVLAGAGGVAVGHEATGVLMSE